MLGARTARHLSGHSRRTRGKTARTAGGSAIKDGLTALNSSSLRSRRRCRRGFHRCFVDRTRPCLRHHHATNRLRCGHGSGRSRCGSWRSRRGWDCCRGCGFRSCRRFGGRNRRPSCRGRWLNNRRRGGGNFHGCRSLNWRRRRNLRLCGCFRGRLRLSRRSRDRRLHHHCAGMRHNCDRGPSRRDNCRGFRHDRARRRLARNRPLRGRRGHDRRRWPRRWRHDLSRLRTRRRGHCGRCGNDRRGRLYGCLGWRSCGNRPRRRPMGLDFFFVLLGEDRFGRVSGLGNMGKIELRRDRLPAAGR